MKVNKEGNIRFGLGAVKGVGENAVRCIIEEREKNGPFTDIFDFVQRVNLSACNRKNIECIAMSGGFDCFGLKRECYMSVNSKSESFSEILVRYGNKYQIDQNMQFPIRRHQRRRGSPSRNSRDGSVVGFGKTEQRKRVDRYLSISPSAR